MKRLLLILLSLVLIAAALAGCSDNTASAGGGEAADRADDDIAWQYKTADETRDIIENGEPGIILDIRVEDNFNEGHLPGAISCFAFPVDTPELEEQLLTIKDQLNGDEPIIVVCEGGQKGAKRTISVLTENGVSADRLYILEGGAQGWPHDDMLVAE